MPPLLNKAISNMLRARFPVRPLALCGVLALGACAIGPNYRAPSTPAPAALAGGLKEAKGWTPAEPLDGLERGAWWRAFQDETLDGLEAKIAVSNQTLKAQEAVYRQARAALEITNSGLFPTLSASASGQRAGGDGAARAGKTFTVAGTAGWSVDLWGKVRRQIEQARADVQMSAAELANVRLSLQATLAADYFQLRAYDEQVAILNEIAANDARTLKDAENQYAAGLVTAADVAAAKSQLATARAALIDAEQSRAVLEHAIAALTGEPATTFSLTPGKLGPHAPAAPLSWATTLLQRRPDVAAAERSAAAASAGIGVAEAVWFPSLTLSATDQSTAGVVADLFKASTSSWAYGASASATLLDVGARQGQVRSARAAYDQAVAQYRGTVLSALANVEDQAGALRRLEAETPLREEALQNALKSEQVVENQYRAGTVAYTAVITAQNTRLAAAQTLVSTRLARAEASVGLIEAFGGGWNREETPLR
jgi:NodT family efflux transporter outer membrane factor (OMF) lipoprotein